jgi:Ser/Thr protein kinase RdoA (MazF antagonist)
MNSNIPESGVLFKEKYRMDESNFQKRINYKGDLKILLQKVCMDYDFGLYQYYKIVPVGYEDFNVVLTTSKGKYFVKLLANFRDKKESERYIDLMLTVVNAGIHHPKLYKTKNDEYLYEFRFENTNTYLCVLEFIEGKTFYDLNEQPTMNEMRFLAQQASLINQLPIKPEHVYDSWAVENFLREFEKKKEYLEKEDLEMVKQVVKEFENIDLDTLPHCFVHGDIIMTNVMRTNNGELFILDFSVSNYYPLIQELSVLFCDLFFNEKDPSNFKECYELGIEEYQKQIKLTSEELKALPIYTKAAHAIHVLLPTYERNVKGNMSEENLKWLELGRKGLEFSLRYWQ